ncbi:MAG TPA: adenine phosphoribosyltransferase, partial [Deltaproteobacteria bacterium]|nr:adenine phosphoribosyltransferase [Deltaproteobacteria bacterium]
MDDLKLKIRTIPNFPIPGIQFRDITTLLADPDAFNDVIERFVNHYQDEQIDLVVGIEARGFIIGAPLALRLGKGFIPIRKEGKLPGPTHGLDYELEYGSDR